MDNLSNEHIRRLIVSIFLVSESDQEYRNRIQEILLYLIDKLKPRDKQTKIRIHLEDKASNKETDKEIHEILEFFSFFFTERRLHITFFAKHNNNLYNLTGNVLSLLKLSNKKTTYLKSLYELMIKIVQNMIMDFGFNQLIPKSNDIIIKENDLEDIDDLYEDNPIIDSDVYSIFYISYVKAYDVILEISKITMMNFTQTLQYKSIGILNLSKIRFMNLFLEMILHLNFQYKSDSQYYNLKEQSLKDNDYNNLKVENDSKIDFNTLKTIIEFVENDLFINYCQGFFDTIIRLFLYFDNNTILHKEFYGIVDSIVHQYSLESIVNKFFNSSDFIESISDQDYYTKKMRGNLVNICEIATLIFLSENPKVKEFVNKSRS